MGDALRAIGQTLAGLGPADPRLQPSGKLEFCLGRQLAAYNKQDPPPTRVKPIPIDILWQTCTIALLTPHLRLNVIADTITLGFFFLLRPGEYAHTANPESSLFCLCDLHLMIGNRRLHHITCPNVDLVNVNFIGLEFTNQKNGVHGEIIGLGRSGDVGFCPVEALINCVRHLRHHHAPPTTPLHNCFDHHQWHPITAAALTDTLCNTVHTLGFYYGIAAADLHSIALLLWCHGSPLRQCRSRLYPAFRTLEIG